MANSAGRRKNLRQQNSAMRKALQKLRSNPAMADASQAVESAAIPTTETGIIGKGIGKLSGLRGAGTSILGLMMLQRLMGLPGELGERSLRRESITQQAESMTPESLYLQAALPQAQQEEDMARQALYAQLTGGVIGPSLATGETRIGR